MDNDKLDAARYRWLKKQHWSMNTTAVVLFPKEAVKLGSYCPSGYLLDEEIDARMKSSKPEPTQEQKPLGEKVSETAKPEETWKPFGPNPNIEINSKGQLRTKPEVLK